MCMWCIYTSVSTKVSITFDSLMGCRGSTTMSCRKDITMLEHVQQRATKPVKVLENMAGAVWSQEEEAQGELGYFLELLTGMCS